MFRLHVLLTALTLAFAASASAQTPAADAGSPAVNLDAPTVEAEPAVDAAPEPALTPVPAATPETTSAAEGLYVEFGRGVTLRGENDRFSLTLRGRVQTRMTARTSETDGEDADVFFEVRRARLVFLGELPEQELQLYVQLGLGSSDLDAERPVPLRDAVVTWTPLRDLNVRVGQMKVPFSRERVISSSALQLVDRSIVNAEFNLDRDVGVQLFSNNAFGLSERLAWQLGVYGGAGRNRTEPGTGLIYVARLQFSLLGQFADTLVEADLTRSRTPRLSVGVAAAIHGEARRVRTNQGAEFDGGPRESRHLAADLLFKWAGFSLQSEFLLRDFNPNVRNVVADDAIPSDDIAITTELGRSGYGWFVQAGYVTPIAFEVSARWAEIRPLGTTGQDSALPHIQTATWGVGQYFMKHDLKLQADYGLEWDDSADRVSHEGRVQLQVFF